MIIIPIIQALAALYVLVVSFLSYNRMSRATPGSIRWAFIALGGAALAAILSCVTARDVFDCLAWVGIALYLKGDRRASKS